MNQRKTADFLAAAAASSVAATAAATIHPPPPPPSVASHFFPPPFESCLDTFAAAAAALSPEKSLKNGGGNGGGESSSALGISDYGLWPHPTAAAAAAAAAAMASNSAPAFPFPYSFFWPSKRGATSTALPTSTPPFTPFHTSLLGTASKSRSALVILIWDLFSGSATASSGGLKDEKDGGNSVLQWMERRQRSTRFFMDETNPVFP